MTKKIIGHSSGAEYRDPGPGRRRFLGRRGDDSCFFGNGGGSAGSYWSDWSLGAWLLGQGKPWFGSSNCQSKADNASLVNSKPEIPQPELRLSTDKQDYAPGQTLLITASGFALGSTIQFAIADDPKQPGDDGNADVYKPFAVTDGGPRDLDGNANGQVVAAWVVPSDNNGSGSGIPDALNGSLNLTARSSDGQIATTTFTDAQASTNKVYQHWADADGAEWNNNILNDVKSNYFEGEVIPHVFFYKASPSQQLINGQTYSFNVTYNYYQQKTDAGGFTYITTYDISREPSEYFTAAVPGITPILDESFVNNGGFTNGLNAAGYSGFYTVDADITNVSSVTYDPLTAGATKDGIVTINFKYTGATTSDGLAAIYYGLYVAKPGEVPDQGKGTTNGANAWSGGSLQTTVDIGGTGATSIQLNPDAIIAGEISGIKFNDLNANGVLDPGEPGLAGWTIVLDKDRDTSNGNLQSIVTANGTSDDLDGNGVIDPMGYYYFSVTPDADKATSLNDPYYIYEVNQSGWTQTAPAPAPPGIYGPLTVSAEKSSYLDQNFGNTQNFQNFSISGVKYTDLNGDGLLNGDSAGTPGFSFNVNLYAFTDIGADGLADDGEELKLVKQTSTDPLTGTWSFHDLGSLGANGFYLVKEEEKSGWAHTVGDKGYTVAATSGNDDNTDNYFGNFKNIDLSCYKWIDTNGNGDWDSGEEAVNGWEIILDDDPDSTNGNLGSQFTHDELDGLGNVIHSGFYDFSNISPVDPETGELYTKLYVYEENRAGFVQTFGNYSVDVKSGTVVNSPYGKAEIGNFGNFKTFSISGFKWLDDNRNGKWEEGDALNPYEKGLNGIAINLGVDTNADGTSDSFLKSTLTAASNAKDGFYEFTDLGPLGEGSTYVVYETVSPGYIKTYPSPANGFAYDPVSGENQAGVYGAGKDEPGSKYNFGNAEANGPGARTPGFWVNWYSYWDGTRSNDPKQVGTTGFAAHDVLTLNGDPTSADKWTVLDPITNSQSTGLLIGDWNLNGKQDAGEDAIFYSLPEAKNILNASTKQLQDGRWQLARDVVSGWLNYEAGNSVGNVYGSIDTPKEYLMEGIDWLQAFTNDETPLTSSKDGFGDGNITQGKAVAQSSVYWNAGVTGLNYPASGYANSASDMPFLAGNLIHQNLDAFNNAGWILGAA